MASKEDDRYEFDPFDDGSSRRVGERLHEKFRDFVEETASKLREIEETLDQTLADVWDASADPIGLALEPYEQATLPELVKTDNKALNKVLLVFASLCSEARSLCHTAETQFYYPILLFGEEQGEAAEEGDAQVQIGRMLDPFLMNLSKFCHRVYAVVQNMVRQLASLYSRSQKLYAAGFSQIHFKTVFEHLGQLLGVLVTLDAVVERNEALATAWKKFKRMTRFCKASASRFQTSEKQLDQFEKLLLSLEGQLFGGTLFAECVDQEFDYLGVVEVRKNEAFRQELQNNIRSLHLSVSSRLGTLAEEDSRFQYVGLCCLQVLYYKIYRDYADKPFFKQLYELHRVAPIVHLFGNVTWVASDFFRAHAPEAVAALGKLELEKFRAALLAQLDASLDAQVRELFLKVSVWMTRMESNLTNRASTREILSTRATLVTHGPTLAYRVAHLFKTVTYLHMRQNVAVNRSVMLLLFRCIEMLKGIEATFHRCSSLVGESLSYMVQVTSSELQRKLLPLKRRLETSKKMTDALLDALAAVVLALKMLNGPTTASRMLILQLCVEVLLQGKLLTDADTELVRGMMQRLRAESELVRKIREACDTHFFYWNRELVRYYYRHLYAHPEMAHHLHYMFAALRDIIPVLRQTVHTDPKVFLEAYHAQVEAAFREEILERLCHDIETNLRLHVHAHMGVEKNRDPFRVGVTDLASFCKVKPIRFFDKTLDIGSQVAHYLDTTFYNLNTVALFDWKTYAEMRNLAEEKYGLRLTEVHLPGATLEQGLDVLEIMRNIHIFVSTYCYNLNQQMFIQRQTEQNKTLVTISIPHISNSIRTHGLGIMNTTVNFTYQFLRQKFAIFSQFLYDDHIKSRLFRDIKYFRENKAALGSCYPFERADTFNREIRKLGASDQGSTYLDQFRMLVTEIGNAMGYIRMIRSGGLNYTANAIKFVPDLQTLPNFEALAQETGLTGEACEAARNLNVAVDSLARNFAEGTEYFRMLVNVFAREFRDERNAHLRNFYIIVPPLLVNFVEHSLLQKDKMNKPKSKEGNFTDDGLAIGVAYILKLLGQYSDFDSLHWWDSVRDRYGNEIAKLELLAVEFKKAGKTSDDERTRALTLRKLESHRSEYELVQWSFESSRVFFNYDDKTERLHENIPPTEPSPPNPDVL